MRPIVHLSDLHFGTEEPCLADAVLAEVAALKPNVVVVTGDLTQRARRHEFADARRFLDAITAPRVVVPGNHDIPLYNVGARFGWPLHRYHKFVSTEMKPTFADGEIAVAGVNTARSNTWKDGRVSVEDIAWLRDYFAAQPVGAFKILAAHHPFIPPAGDPDAPLVGRAVRALRALASVGCHLILAGHLHQGYAGDVQSSHEDVERSILVVQAGTAISHRRRGDPNAFNVLTIDGVHLQLVVRAWTGREFAPSTTSEYQYDDAAGWIAALPGAG
jgi:3',5'-cyclic AMP phosphodiesterase CpdA